MLWGGVILILLLSLPACAGKQDHSIPADISGLYLAPFENSSSETGLENLLTDEVTQQFLSDGRLSLVSREQADAMLVGEIQRYRRIPLIYNEQDVVQQYKLRVEINLRLLDPETQKVLRSWPMIFQETTYSDVIAPIETELDAQERVLRQLARDVVTFTVEGWPYLKTRLPRRDPVVKASG